jgi:hypothetical protein
MDKRRNEIQDAVQKYDRKTRGGQYCVPALYVEVQLLFKILSEVNLLDEVHEQFRFLLHLCGGRERV